MHRRSYYIIIAIYFCAKTSKSESNFLLNNSEYLKSISVMKHLEIRHCMFVWDYHQENTFVSVKHFSKEKIMTSAITYKALIEYFKVGVFPNVNTMIIIKEHDLLNIIEIFEEFDELNITFRASRFTWLVFLESYKTIDGEKLNVPYNCRFLIASLVKENDYRITEVYKVKDRAFSFEYQTFDKYITDVPNNFLYSKRMNLNGTELEVNAEEPFLTIFQISEDKEDGVISRKEPLVVSDIRKLMNFQYRYEEIEVDDHKNVTVEGDFYLMPLPFHSDFFSSNFLAPIFRTRINWYIKSPNMEDEGDYTQPLHKNLWFCIFSYILFNSLFLILIKKMLKEKISSTEVAFIALDTFCYQKGSRDFKINSIRIVCISLWLIAMLLINLYNAIITSYLSIRIPHIPFKNLEEFSKNGQYRLAFHDQSFAGYYLKSSNDPLLRHIYNNASIIFDYATMDTAVEEAQRICNEKLALPFIDDRIYTVEFKCGIYKVENPIAFAFTGIKMGENSPFKEAANYNLIRFYTSGIQKRLQKSSVQDSGKNTIIQDSLNPFGAKQVYQIFFLQVTGIFLAAIIFIFEFCYQKFKGDQSYL